MTRPSTVPLLPVRRRRRRSKKEEEEKEKEEEEDVLLDELKEKLSDAKRTEDSV